MFPDLFSIDSITVHTYGLFVALGFVAAIILTLRLGSSAGIGPSLIVDMGVYVIAAAIVGSRLMYVLVHLEYFKVHPLEALKIWRGGLAFSGGIIAVLITVFCYGKRHLLSFWAAGDLWAPGAALGQAVGRIGCFMAGCCYGKPASGPLGVVFTDANTLAPQNITLYPTQILSAAGGGLMAIVLLMIYKKKKFPGQVLLWYLIFHSTLCLLVEKYRGDRHFIFTGSPMSANQTVALLMLAGAIVALLVLKWKINASKIARS